MLATVSSASLLGIHGHAVTVEVHVGQGLPGFAVVGLPDASCREARDRVRAAVLSSCFGWPQQRITVNLAPSGVPKSGAGLDLAIAVGILVASDQLHPRQVHDTAFVAELGLDGSLRPVPGALPLTAATDAASAVLAQGNWAEASLVEHVAVRGAGCLRDVVESLRGERPWDRPPTVEATPPPPTEVDFADIQGQVSARRAAEVAAAGGHHLLLVGPPGAGKTMIAKALPGLLPELDEADALEVTTVQSAAGIALPPSGLVRRPPLRAPHHTSSMVSLIGGGTRSMRPGEISCAHGGVLFLDELGEFPPMVLDALRQPLEEGSVRVARAYGAVSFPARFILVGATNPCPCGEATATDRPCECSPVARARYRRRLSGPLLDRFDLRVPVQRPGSRALFAPTKSEPTAAVARRVAQARARATRRGTGPNVTLRASDAAELLALESAAQRMLVDAVDDGRLSARGVHRVRCVARTVADLEGHDGPLRVTDVALALTLRGTVFADDPTLRAAS